MHYCICLKVNFNDHRTGLVIFLQHQVVMEPAWWLSFVRSTCVRHGTRHFTYILWINSHNTLKMWILYKSEVSFSCISLFSFLTNLIAEPSTALNFPEKKVPLILKDLLNVTDLAKVSLRKQRKVWLLCTQPCLTHLLSWFVWSSIIFSSTSPLSQYPDYVT